MINLNDIAERILDIDPYEARNNDETPETLAEKLNDIETCHETIEYLLGIIDDLQ